MPKILGLVGFIGSGKGTVAKILSEKYNFRQDSFASTLKDVCASVFGWPRELLEGDTTESRIWRDQTDEWWANKLNIKNFTPRYALQNIGTDIFRNHFNEDIWFHTMENRLRKNNEQDIIVSDIRFPNEIKFIQQYNGHLIRVKRGPDPQWYQIAVGANKGSIMSKAMMDTEYKNIHQSEWAWAGCKISYEILNNSSLDNLEIQIDEIIKNLGPK